MKSYAPKGLNGSCLRDLMADLHATQDEVCKYLDVGERTFRRWLADENAPRAALLALWHLTPAGLHSAAVDVGNEAMHAQGLARARGEALAVESARLARVLAISDTGAANDPLVDGPHSPPPIPRKPASCSPAHPNPQASIYSRSPAQAR